MSNVDKRIYVAPPGGTFQEIDGIDNIVVPMNFSIADFREPGTRDNYYSLLAPIPGTANNNRIFRHAYEVTADWSFNPHLRARARIIIDGHELPEFSMRLFRIETTDGITYDVQFTGGRDDLYQAMGDELLTALDFSDAEHVYNQASIVASWSYAEPYVYPMIDYTDKSDRSVWDVRDFRPAIKLKEYVDRIFARHGFKYQSEFFDGVGSSTYFNAMVVPYNSSTFRLSAQEIEDRGFAAATDANSHTDNVAVVPIGIGTGNVEDLLFKDYTPKNYGGTPLFVDDKTYVVRARGRYHVRGNVYPTLRIFTSGSFVSAIDFEFQAIAELWINGSFSNNAWLEDLVIPSGTTFSSGENLFNVAGFEYLLPNIPYEVGDEIEIRFKGRNLSNLTSTPITSITLLVDPASTLDVSVSDPRIQGGDNITSAMMLPDNVTQAELIKWVILMFNLYVVADPQNPNLLYIEPRDDFYKNGKVLDWSNKLARERNITITPLATECRKRYIYGYTPDDDFWNKVYSDNYKNVASENETYGDHLETTPTAWTNEIERVHTGFSPGVLVQDTGSGDSKVITTIIKQAGNGSTDRTGRLRCLFFQNLPTNPWALTENDQGGITLGTYPYAGHLNHPSTPNQDLNFGLSQAYYFPVNLLTTNTIFNRFHLNEARLIADKNSRMLTGYFLLDASDIAQLDFRDTIYVDGQAWHISQINDHGIGANVPTKVELITAVTATTFEGEVVPWYGDEAGNPDIVLPGGRMAPAPAGNDNITGRNWIVTGNNNIAQGYGHGIIQGDNNNISRDATGITIVGSGNVVEAGGVENVRLINTDNFTVTTAHNGKTIIDGEVFDQPEIVIGAFTPSPTPTINGVQEIIINGQQFKFVTAE